MDHHLLKIIACSVCNGKPWLSQGKQELICKLGNLTSPLRDGTPVLLEIKVCALTADEGRP